ncbi:MAG: hypothetical protein GH155_02780 [Spirochaeta sp.]|nr:hypothetical protein [Spirochaeta sp.]
MTVNEDLLSICLTSGEAVFRIYEPVDSVIVLGAGRRAANDLLTAGSSGIPVLKRKGGGGTVVLSPGQVVLALVKEVSHPFGNREYAQTINSWFKQALSEMGISGMEERGISDLCLGGRKILGSSLFRRRRILFYQASLLVCNDLTLFSRYLSYPSIVPEYRQGRSHEAFCTNLHREGFTFPVAEVIERLERVVRQRLPQLL